MTEKRIKKLIEEIIVDYQDEFVEKFSKEEIESVVKHRTKVSEIGLEDDRIKNLIKDEVEDCIGVYLLNKDFKKKKRK